MKTNNPSEPAIASIVLELGMLCITPAAREALERRGAPAGVYLTRHATGDFGDLDKEDRARNVAALESGARVFSSYDLPGRHDDSATKVWIITESDRRVTTILLPSDY